MSTQAFQPAIFTPFKEHCKHNAVSILSLDTSILLSPMILIFQQVQGPAEARVRGKKAKGQSFVWGDAASACEKLLT